MPYVNDGASNNGKRPSFIGEIATEYAATRVAGVNPILAAILKVVRTRQASGHPPQLGLTVLQKASGLFNPVAPTTTYTAPTPIRTPVVNITDAVKQVTATTTRMTNTVPVVQVATLPNGTAVPVPTGSRNDPYGAGAPAYGSPITDPSQLPDFTGTPEVGTFDNGGDSNISTAGMSNALAGLTSSKPLLAGIALLAFLMLDGKPKRRRR